MTLVLQIVLAVVVLAGLVTAIMTVKSWHWAQMLLVLGIFLFALADLVMGLEVYRIHKVLRSGIPKLEQDLAKEVEKRDALTFGADAAMASVALSEVTFDTAAEGRMPGLSVWIRRLQELEKRRGPVWVGVTPIGQVDPATGRLPVTISNPQPHGLAQDAIVYAFEEGEPNAANPEQGSQYLGVFRVVEVRPEGATLEAVQRLDNRTGNRLVKSQRPWILYETMPADKHELFLGKPEDQLRQLLPAASVEDYVRDGQPATPDDDELHRAGYDEQDQRLGPDDAAKAVKWLYDRQLRDYAYLFSAAHRELVQLSAERIAMLEDAKKLRAAHEIAKKLSALRTEEKQALTGDLTHMTADRRAIETLLASITGKLAEYRQKAAQLQSQNEAYVAQLRAEQQGALRAGEGAAASAGGAVRFP